ncbi:MAG: FliA/WhiG family RNA polymerase sigma factor [Oscillospiraceae bacterium]|nr:FliA/WhiG family RNA polymerase sigma factor [Oscillospiraceae bacterium]MCL2278260.1 FliA/WhiG family RNA polymerase sigma factor [Oscillospiraceae bacterium]
MAETKHKLTPEEIGQLWIAFKEQGETGAKDELLIHYGYLVKWIVRRMMPKYNDYNEYDDLVSCGMIGLIDAVDKFSLKHEVKFETYAVTRVRGEILDYMRSQDWASPSLRKKITAITNAYEEFEAKNPGQVVDQEVADKVGLPVDQVHKVLNQSHMFNLINFEDALGTGNAEAEIRAVDEKSPEDELIEKEKKEILVEVIDSLPEKERMVISLYYYDGLLLKEIADILQVTESRVSQIHSKVLTKMRVKLEKVI